MWIINTNSNEVVQIVDDFSAPSGLALNDMDRTLYVADYGKRQIKSVVLPDHYFSYSLAAAAVKSDTGIETTRSAEELEAALFAAESELAAMKRRVTELELRNTALTQQLKTAESKSVVICTQFAKK